MKSRWSLSLILSLMLCLPLQGIASLLMHCPARADAVAAQMGDLQPDAASQPCHEAEADPQQAPADSDAPAFSCAACDLHCSALVALPATMNPTSSLLLGSAHPGVNDPPRDGIVHDAQTRPPITFLL